jgi:curved DNA-binding protein CbpA
MNTLYDLLEALPSDDADGLRTAFRKAVKGAHPDLKPDDPDAALKFRQIVNANQILGDAQLRAAYDDLLEAARDEEEATSRCAAAAKTRKLASGAIAFAGVSVAAVAGVLLFMHMSAATVASANHSDDSLRNSPEIAAADPAESSDTGLSAAKLESASAGVPTIQPDSKFLPAYADSRVIFYRFRKLDHAFPGSAKASRSKSGPSAIARAAWPSWRIRMAAQDPSRGEGGASAMVR